jgi:hypothetical protein
METFDIDSDDAVYLLELHHIRNVDFSFRPVYVYKRLNPSDVIVRMAMNYITNGEIWYLRLLMLNFPMHGSIRDAYKFGGVSLGSFQAVAVARHLVTDLDEAERCFEESIVGSTPAELRSLLVMLTCEGFPTLRIYHNHDFRRALYEDFLHGNHGNECKFSFMK